MFRIQNEMAMNRELVKELIVENQSFVEKQKFVERPFFWEEQGNYVLLGLRRSGKSYLMYQRIHQLLQKGHVAEEFFYINFEDDRLIGLSVMELNELKSCYEELYHYTPIFFLDEIQIIEGWEKFVRRLADTGYRVYVTGSNAKMLSSEIATTLGGRFLIQEVYPYSFQEYLKASGIILKENWLYLPAARNEVVRAFDSFFHFGGLPELVQFEDKRTWLGSLYQKIFFGDLIARYGIRNSNALRMLIKKLAESVKQPSSYNRLANVVSTAGVKVGTQTIIEYLTYVQETWLMFSVENYAAKFSEKETTKKYYFRDNGLLNLFLFDPETSLLENMVAIALKKQYGEHCYYYNQNVEIDFYIPDECLAIQVSYNIDNDETLKREVNALQKAVGHLQIKEMYIVTRDQERIIEKEGLTIRVLPIWKWLLSFY